MYPGSDRQWEDDQGLYGRQTPEQIRRADVYIAYDESGTLRDQ